MNEMNDWMMKLIQPLGIVRFLYIFNHEYVFVCTRNVSKFYRAQQMSFKYICRYFSLVSVSLVEELQT